MDLADLTTTVPWWHYAIAVAAVVAALILAGFARRAVRRLLQRTKGIPETLADVTARFSGYLVILLGVGVGLAAIGIDVQPLLAIVLIVLVVAVFVLKGVADNFAAGVLLQTSHPVALGDEIAVETPDGAVTGTVLELGSRTVVVAAYDGRTIHVPNAQLVNDAIVVTPASASRRSEVQVRVARGGRGVDALLARIAQITAEAPSVGTDPAPQASALAISPERLIARVRFWHVGRDGSTVTAGVVRQLADALATDGLVAAVSSGTTVLPLTPADTI